MGYLYMKSINKISDKVTKGNFATYIKVLSEAFPSYIDSYKKKYRQMIIMIDGGTNLKDIYLSDNPVYIYTDSPDTMDIFVWVARDTYKTEIKNGSQLRELTGLLSEPPDDMQNLFLSAMAFRLENTLVCAIRRGLKYKDLLEIDLQDFNLPDEWIDPVSEEFTSKNDVIKLAIASATGLGEHSKRRPSLQNVADALDAPFELIEEISEMYGG